MNEKTIDALYLLNRDFYRRRGADFSATRRRPWPGWERALEVYRARCSPRTGGRILDLGCGNGRLGAFLAPELGAHHSYLGLDASPTLLAAARRFPGGFPGAHFAAADLMAAPWPLASRFPGFSWVTAFGVLHHIPGRANRQRFMRLLGRVLAPGGLVAVSCWQFAALPRFRRRVTEREDIDRRELEHGDYLLRWGNGDDVRYCHHIDDVEAERLVAASGLERLDSYRSDGEGGALNLYLLLARAAAPETVAGAGG